MEQMHTSIDVGPSVEPTSAVGNFKKKRRKSKLVVVMLLSWLLLRVGISNFHYLGDANNFLLSQFLDCLSSSLTIRDKHVFMLSQSSASADDARMRGQFSFASVLCSCRTSCTVSRSLVLFRLHRARRRSIVSSARVIIYLLVSKLLAAEPHDRKTRVFNECGLLTLRLLYFFPSGSLN